MKGRTQEEVVIRLKVPGLVLYCLFLYIYFLE